MASRDHPRFFDDVTALPPPPANLVELGKWIPHTVEFSVSTWVGIDSAFYEPPSEDVLAAYARPFLPVAPAGFPYAVELPTPELFDRRARRGAGAARGGARVQLVDRNADVQGADRSAVDVSRR